MRTTCFPAGGAVLNAGVRVVTRRTSACRSRAARSTPGQSVALA